MTYCLGLCLNDGLVFASDSRTNAGVDYVTSYSKMHMFQPAPDRLFTILSAGNLATTQEIMNHIQRDLDHADDTPNLVNVRYLVEAAEYVASISVQVQKEHREALSKSGISGETTLIIGGQISGQPHGLMLIYPQGNYINASRKQVRKTGAGPDRRSINVTDGGWSSLSRLSGWHHALQHNRGTTVRGGAL